MENDVEINAAETKDEPQPEPDEESQALIEAFLSKTDGGALTESEVPLDWHEESLPEGHQSGFVALIGRPNVGKSTLVNALVGEKVAIVSRKPQTTRKRLMGIRTEPEHQLIFIDTPGVHKSPRHRLNKKMIEQAVAAIPDADVILFVVDVSVPYGDEDEIIARLLKEKAAQRPVIFVLNKMDKLALDEAEARIEGYWGLFPTYTDSMPTSALRGTNVARLLDHILEHIPEGPRYYPDTQVTDQSQYHIAAELIREAALRYTHQEVPHATAILVEDFEERDNGTTYISARIWVERASQKPIVIGKDGQRIKQIGIAARKELERFVGGKVYLDLWVKVKPKWRDQEPRLRELGFA